MKTLYKLVTLVAVALAPALASAAALPPPTADLTVLAGRGQRFLLSLDGRPLTGMPTRQLHVGWLAPGRHQADLQVFSPYGAAVGMRTTIWLQPGTDSRFAVADGPYGPQLQPLGGPAMGPPVAPPPPGPAYPPPAPAPPYPAPAPPYPAPSYPQPGPGGSYGGYPPAPNGGYGSYPQPVPGGTYGYPAAPALVPMSPADAAGLVQALRNATFDSNRLPLVQQALGQSYLQSEQLAALVRTMDFDESQRRVAVLGYAHLADPQNFYRVLGALTFPTSTNRVLDELGLPR